LGNIPAAGGSLVLSVLHLFFNTFRAAQKSDANITLRNLIV
jgi:hypothetical protein